MLNGKPVIGIMPTSVYMKDDNPSNDYCSYTNTYVETILECGGIPYFIPLAGEKVIPDAMEMIDGGETDTKLIGVIDCDPRYTHIKTMKDLNQHLLAEIKDFFENYKNLQKKKVIVRGFKDQAWAIKEYKECVAMMKKYGKMKKEAFVKKMMKAHPNKYR